EALEVIEEAGGEALYSCYQCGLCSDVCPWNLVATFMPHRLIGESKLGLVDFESEAMWQCATCAACVKRCPRGVALIDIMRALRRTIVGMGIGPVPESLRVTVKNIAGVKNPLGEDPARRADWANELDVKAFTEGTEILYFPCCVPAYEPKARRMAVTAVNLLKKAGVGFGILGTAESCCGESVRKAGDEDLFARLATSNIDAFTKNGVQKIVTASPHCYHTFKNEYPELDGKFEVVHYTQYLADLIREGRLKPTKELPLKVTYHDSCYLGRHNNIYEEPREVLKSIPGLELVEMENSRENALCCGGGGGRIWQDTKKGERFSDVRVQQAIDTGASVLATVCPYCLLNFEDSVLSENKSDVLQIKDVSELLWEAL
ncbi:MAG: Fe-S oxidoreductase, partial [Chloroflexi bacterium RBG_13_54_9]